MIRKKLAVALSALMGVALMGVLPGCAFIEAASFGPNLSDIHVSTQRAVVEAELGHPRTRVLSKPGVTVDIYEYHVNNNPSRLRAIGNLIKSFFTLGIWEFWSKERSTLYRLRIVYDSKQKVTEIRQVDIFADQIYEDANR